jgi:hypothetical protein
MRRKRINSRDARGQLTMNSIWQVALQPSSELVFPSSQVSP